MADTGLAADITAAAAADLDLEPGQTVHFVVKAQEVRTSSGARDARRVTAATSLEN